MSVAGPIIVIVVILVLAVARVMFDRAEARERARHERLVVGIRRRAARRSDESAEIGRRSFVSPEPVDPEDARRRAEWSAPILVGWLASTGWNRESLRAAPFGILADFVQDNMGGTDAEWAADKLRSDGDYRRRFRANCRTQRQVDERLNGFLKRKGGGR